MESELKHEAQLPEHLSLKVLLCTRCGGILPNWQVREVALDICKECICERAWLYSHDHFGRPLEIQQ